MFSKVNVWNLRCEIVTCLWIQVYQFADKYRFSRFQCALDFRNFLLKKCNLLFITTRGITLPILSVLLIIDYQACNPRIGIGVAFKRPGSVLGRLHRCLLVGQRWIGVPHGALQCLPLGASKEMVTQNTSRSNSRCRTCHFRYMKRKATWLSDQEQGSNCFLFKIIEWCWQKSAALLALHENEGKKSLWA